MLNVTQQFKDAVKASSRQLEGAVRLHFLGVPVAEATATASTQYSSSTPPSQVCNGRFRSNSHTSAGYLPAIFAEEQKGWRGALEANVSGVLPQAETLTVDYSAPVKGTNYWVVGIPGYYPVNFTVERKVNDVWETIADVINNVETIRYFTASSEYVQATRLTITRISPSKGNARIMQFGLITSVMFEGHDLVSLHLLEEAGTFDDGPLLGVTSNECAAILTNELKWFTPRNRSSPFFSLVGANLLFEAYVGVTTATQLVEYVPLGTFKAGDWTTPANTLEASFIGHDQMQDIFSVPTPLLPVQLGTNLKALYELLFTALGLSSTSYDVDSTLTHQIPYGWFPSGTVLETIKTLSASANCCVFMSRGNVIKVRSVLSVSTPSVDVLTDVDTLNQVDNPQIDLNTFSSIVVNCAQPSVQEEVEIARLPNVAIPTGGRTFKAIKFLGGPVLAITQIKLLSSVNTSTTSFTNGSWSLNLQVENLGVEELVTITVYGKVISTTPIRVVSTEVDTDAARARTYTIDSYLVQTLEHAETYAADLLAYTKDPLADILLTYRGDPSLELFDVVTVDDASDAVPSIDVFVLSHTLSFDGGLEASMETKIKL